ncbi:MAG: PKD domain-containing protein, partial [Saprospiraceae bacterium]|nr:PKD domain-containing protein [Saprospiraceae bacterium]
MDKCTNLILRFLLVFSGFIFFNHQSFAQNCGDVDFKFEIKELTVTFKGESKEIVKDWFWYFGDNAINNGQEVKHTFEKNGEYNVCLKILTTSGCIGSVCKKINIGTIVSSCDLKADYAFKVEGTTGVFTAKSNDVNAKYYWQIANQTSQYNGIEVKIPFEKAGVYEVCLIALNQSETCKVLVCKKVEIGATCGWEADFTYENDGNIIKLTAKSTVGDAAKYYWSFGNGATGEGSEVKYQYDKAGNYEVCLKIVSGILSNTAGTACTKSVCKKVTIGTSCDWEADFTFENTGN